MSYWDFCLSCSAWALLKKNFVFSSYSTDQPAGSVFRGSGFINIKINVAQRDLGLKPGSVYKHREALLPWTQRKQSQALAPVTVQLLARRTAARECLLHLSRTCHTGMRVLMLSFAAVPPGCQCTSSFDWTSPSRLAIHNWCSANPTPWLDKVAICFRCSCQLTRSGSPPWVSSNSCRNCPS